MKRSNLVIIIVVLALLVAGAVYVVNNNSAQNQPNTENADVDETLTAPEQEGL